MKQSCTCYDPPPRPPRHSSCTPSMHQTLLKVPMGRCPMGPQGCPGRLEQALQAVRQAEPSVKSRKKLAPCPAPQTGTHGAQARLELIFNLN